MTNIISHQCSICQLHHTGKYGDCIKCDPAIYKEKVLQADCEECDMLQDENGSECPDHAGQRGDTLYEAYKENGMPKHS